MTNQVSVARLHELLSYDAREGALYWRERDGNRRFNSRYAGRRAFTCCQSEGYPHSTVDGVPLLAHRVAWAMHYGSWPETHIDHINGARADFRIENLRAASQAENMKNVAKSRRNSSGVTGVSFNKRQNKWVAYISSARRIKPLGVFACKTAAVIARKAAELRHGYHPNHGRAS